MPKVSNPGDDFHPFDDKVQIPAGSLSQTIFLSTLDDAIFEGLEEYELTLLADDSKVDVSNAFLSLKIIDNDMPPTISINLAAQSVVEGAGTVLTGVHLSHPSAFEVRVNYSSSDITAVAGTDYLASSGQLVFLPGQVLKNVSTTITDDSDFESNEKFKISLGSIVGQASIDNSHAEQEIIIIDNETISAYISDATAVSEGNSLSFNVSLTQSQGTPTVISWVTEDDTAVRGTHYSGTSGTITIPANTTSGTIVIPTMSIPSEVCAANYSSGATSWFNMNVESGSCSAPVNASSVNMPSNGC